MVSIFIYSEMHVYHHLHWGGLRKDGKSVRFVLDSPIGAPVYYKSTVLWSGDSWAIAGDT